MQAKIFKREKAFTVVELGRLSLIDPTYPDSTARSVPGLPIPAHINNTFATPGSFTGSASPKPGEYPSFRYNVDVFVTSKFSFGNPVSLQNSSPDATEPMPTATTFASFCASCNAINSSPRNRAISHESKSAPAAGEMEQDLRALIRDIPETDEQAVIDQILENVTTAFAPTTHGPAAGRRLEGVY